MSLFHKLLFILPFGMFVSCTSLPNKNKEKSSSKIKTVKVDHKRETSSKITSQTQKKFTEKEILDRLEEVIFSRIIVQLLF